VVPDKPQKIEHFHLGSFHFGEITQGIPIKLNILSCLSTFQVENLSEKQTTAEFLKISRAIWFLLPDFFKNSHGILEEFDLVAERRLQLIVQCESFFNFSCMFLNPNNFSQFEFELF
jgi:hypothetical protein